MIFLKTPGAIIVEYFHELLQIGLLLNFSVFCSLQGRIDVSNLNIEKYALYVFEKGWEAKVSFGLPVDLRTNGTIPKAILELSHICLNAYKTSIRK